MTRKDELRELNRYFDGETTDFVINSESEKELDFYKKIRASFENYRKLKANPGRVEYLIRKIEEKKVEAPSVIYKLLPLGLSFVFIILATVAFLQLHDYFNIAESFWVML